MNGTDEQVECERNQQHHGHWLPEDVTTGAQEETVNTTLDPKVRWAFGTVDISGYERTEPLYAGVLGDGRDRYGTTWRRIELGDHDAALGIELGARARGWLEDVAELGYFTPDEEDQAFADLEAFDRSMDERHPIDRRRALEGFCG